MRFQFDGHQRYQLAAVEAVADLFAGNPWDATTQVAASGNRLFSHAYTTLDLRADKLLDNLKAVQARTLPETDQDAELKVIRDIIPTESGERECWLPNYSVEMETGTGKTYVYLRTALELNRRYGLQKFIIVVPSVAVREGVLKSLEVTRGHLRALYDNVPYRFAVYDAKNITRVRQLTQSDAVELLIMTIDSFNREENVFRQSQDRLNGDAPLHLVQAVRPALILDEPQNMASEGRVKALASLNPLAALRYSATHREKYNLVYRLTPYEAYRSGLVKKIEVASVVKEDDHNQVFLRLDEVRSSGRAVQAKIALHKRMANGRIEEKSYLFKQDDNLARRAERAEYEPFVVAEINPARGEVRFTNGVELILGATRGADQAALFREQIRYAVEEHLRKQKKLLPLGIKVLTLFFVDAVDNYAGEPPPNRGAGNADGLYPGIIRELFDQAFTDLKAGHPHFTDRQPGEVRAAYFASKPQRGGERVLVDTTTGQNKEDRAAYELIMRKKEELLSLANPVAFVFSHSALKEGWDNPNVCQICTLRQVGSEAEKRQQVGRGMRLVVDQTGRRVADPAANVLTVVANESYERFVGDLQREMVAEFGEAGAAPPPTNARKKTVVRRKPLDQLPAEFRALWDRIRQKTRYQVRIDTDRLVAEVVNALDRLTIEAPRIVAVKADVQADADKDELFARQLTRVNTLAVLAPAGPARDVVGMIEDLLEHVEPPIRLTRRTLAAMVARTANRPAAVSNPQEFATKAAEVIREKAGHQLVDGIRYEKLDDWYDMTQWVEAAESGSDKVLRVTKSLYDSLVWQSEPERKFASKLEKRQDVTFFVKLPAWFKVPTPVGNYNPDWALVMDNVDAHGGIDEREPKLYLLRETKGTLNESKLRTEEAQKIHCGRRHFGGALGVDFKVVADADELP